VGRDHAEDIAMTRKIAVVTGTRADYGLLYWILRDLQAAPDCELQLIATGAHFAPAFGRTVDLIREDGFPIAAEVPSLLADDTRVGVAKAIALGILGISDALARLRPDVLLLMADRSEIFAGAVAATTLGIPIAHMSGGEATEGLFDDQFRHAITKMSHLHFPSMDFYRHRLIRMGEDPARVLTVGEPGLDHCTRTQLIDPGQLVQELGLEPSRPFALISLHPVTLELGQTENYIDALLTALDRFPSVQKVLTYPGADPSSHIIVSRIEAYADGRSDVRVYRNLGFRRYLSALRAAAMIIGNSSSGIVEAPSFGVPAVNIGTRQKGRIRARNVIDVGYEAGDIAAGIARALDPAFRDSLGGMQNPYGDGHASGRIVSVLASVDLASLKYKPFYDLSVLGEVRV
jgi:UDP-hydrolysing UDP-N-acetyl-D-glucosamine 2-epimerase